MGRKMEDLYDIHIHLIHGVDDGPDTAEEAEAMLEAAVSEGVRTIIATPHKRLGMFEYDIGTVERNYEELRKKAEELGITLLLGCEYHACGDMADDLKNGIVHTLADTDYVLCEFSYMTPERGMQDTVYKLVANGYRPVIAHAERYGAVQKDIGLCDDLQKRGAFIQINSDSILGLDDRRCKKTARRLLKHDLVDVVASDAHGVSYRKSTLAKAYQYVVKKYGECYAREIFTGLPREILNNNKNTGMARELNNK